MAHSGGREFDRERNTIQAPAEVGNDRRVLVGKGEAMVGGTGAVGEEDDRSIAEAVSICGEISRRRNRVSEVSHAARFNATRVEVVFVGTIS